MPFLVPLTEILSLAREVSITIRPLWEFLLNIFLKRREAHEEQLPAFIGDDSLYQAAVEEAAKERAVSHLGLMFNLLDEVRGSGAQSQPIGSGGVYSSATY